MDFPSLPVPAPAPSKPNNKPKKDKKAKQEKVEKAKKEDNEKGITGPTIKHVFIDENPFQMQATKSNKEKKNNNQNKKFDNDFPTLSSGSASGTKGSILGETNKHCEIEQKYGIVINKNKQKRNYRK